MPGRVSTRARQSDITDLSSSSQKLPTPSTRRPRGGGRGSRESTAAARSVTPDNVPDEGPVTELRRRICSIFGDVQRTTAGHRKLVVNLRKIQDGCAASNNAGKGEEEEEEEESFNREFARCVLRILAAKKSESVGDRLVRFVGLFLKFASDKDNAAVAEEEGEVDDTMGFSETQTTRLTTLVLSTLLPFFNSKEKTVRYRAVQIVSHIINSLDSIDDELFGLLRLSLLKRIRDKESTVRVQAVLGLGRLAGNEAEDEENADGDSDDEESSGLLDRLLEVLQNDSSADVRRSLLLNLPLTPTTLPFLLERARDQDAATRRALYSRLLPALGDFRHLSLSMREKLLRWGLRDRDENVRNAMARLFRERWIEDCAGRQEQDEQSAGTKANGQVEAAPPDLDALTELLERIDVNNSGVEKGIAHEAMKGFWEGRADYRDAISFDEEFWSNLTPETAFMARSFNEFCRMRADSKFDGLVDEKMPEVTALAFFLQRYIADLIARLKRVNNPSNPSSSQEDGTVEGQDNEDDEETIIELEFIVEQLLHIALTLDYSDEVGRRKMYTLLRETLTLPELPDEITRLSVDALRNICGPESAGEREFCEIVLEAVAEVHDTIMGEAPLPEGEDDMDESFHSARSDVTLTSSTSASQQRRRSRSTTPAATEKDDEETKAIKEIVVNMKCLHLAQSMLENVSGQLQSNIHLVTMLNNLVVPAVRSHEAPIRERGLLCLGLCCLLDRELARENLTLFQHIFTKGHAALQVEAVHALADILLCHGPSLLSPLPASAEGPDIAAGADALRKPFLKLFSKALRSPSSSSSDDSATSGAEDVAAASALAVSKLMLSNILHDSDLLKTLIVTYFDPASAPNLTLRQALAYFLPVYGYSRAENQARLGRVVLPALHSLAILAEDNEAFGADDDELGEESGPGEMVGLGVIAAQMLDWTDPRKMVTSSNHNAANGVVGGGGVVESMFDPESGKLLSSASQQPKAPSCDVHLSLAGDVLERIGGGGVSKAEKKTLIAMLPKVYISSSVSDPTKLDEVLALAQGVLLPRGGVSDAAGKNAVGKLVVALGKAGAGVKREREETPAATVTEASAITEEESRIDVDDDMGEEEDGPGQQLRAELKEEGARDETVLDEGESGE